MRLIVDHPTDEQLLALLDGELPAAQRPPIEAHVAGCPRCESRTRAFRASLVRLAGLLERPAAVQSSQRPDRMRLRQALEAAAAEPMPPPAVALVRRLSGWQWLQVAAVLLVGVGMTAMGSSLSGRSVRLLPRGVTGPASPHVTRPMRSATPGAVSAHSAAELCAGARPSRLVTDATRRLVLARYGMSHVAADEYELDALITPELGGTTDAANLWPQRYDSPVWNALVKDDLERLLSEKVCRGEIDLTRAQQAIASDWIAAYKQFFATDTPLASSGSVVDEDEDELVLLPASYSRR